MGVTPTLERSRLELCPVPVDSSGTGLSGAARDSFNTLASALEEAVLFREVDLYKTNEKPFDLDIFMCLLQITQTRI